MYNACVVYALGLCVFTWKGSRRKLGWVGLGEEDGRVVHMWYERKREFNWGDGGGEEKREVVGGRVD